MFSAALCLRPAVFEPANQSAPSRWGAWSRAHLGVILLSDEN